MNNHLPDDIALRIFSYLSAKTLASGFGQTNKRFRALSKDSKLWSGYLKSDRERGWFVSPPKDTNLPLSRFQAIPNVPESTINQSDVTRADGKLHRSTLNDPAKEYALAYAREEAWKRGSRLHRIVLTTWPAFSVHAQRNLSAVSGNAIAVFGPVGLENRAPLAAGEVAVPPRPIAQRSQPARAVRICPGGRIVAAATTMSPDLNGLSFFDLEASLEMKSINNSGSWEKPFAIRWLSENIVATSSNRWLNVHDIRARRTRHRVQVSSEHVRAICVADSSVGPGQNMIGTGSDDGKVQIWDSRWMAPQESLFSIQQRRPVRAMAFVNMPHCESVDASPDTFVLYACFDGTLWLHSTKHAAISDTNSNSSNPAELERILRVPGRAPIEALAYSGGTIVCGGSWNSTLYASDAHGQSWRWAANELGPVHDTSIGQSDRGILVALGLEGACSVVGVSKSVDPV